MIADLEQAAELVARGDVVAFTGAGISAESGIPTFRDPGGLWDRYDPMRFGTFEGIAREAMEHPGELADYLTEMKQAFSKAPPNPGHLALADLERAGLVVGVVTQNVDGLHREAGSATVVEVHGSYRRRVCLSCGNLEEITREEYLAATERTIRGLRTAFVPTYQSMMPPCSVCGGPARWWWRWRKGIRSWRPTCGSRGTRAGSCRRSPATPSRADTGRAVGVAGSAKR